MHPLEHATLARMLPPVLALAHAAGGAILTHYGPAIEVRRKEDASPVTAADEQAEEVRAHVEGLVSDTVARLPSSACEAALRASPSAARSDAWLMPGSTFFSKTRAR